MRTGPAVDRAPTVIATGWGLFKRLAIVALILGIVPVVVVLLLHYWYIVAGIVIAGLVVLFSVLWIDAGRDMRAGR